MSHDLIVPNDRRKLELQRSDSRGRLADLSKPRAASDPYEPTRAVAWICAAYRWLQRSQVPGNALAYRLRSLARFSQWRDRLLAIHLGRMQRRARKGELVWETAKGWPSDALPWELRAELCRLSADQFGFWTRLRSELATSECRVVDHDALDHDDLDQLDAFFQQQVFPILTPLAIDGSHPPPRYTSGRLYLIARLAGRWPGPESLCAVVPIAASLPRFVPLGAPGRRRFVLIEEVIAARLDRLFGGFDVAQWALLRVIRNRLPDIQQESWETRRTSLSAGRRAVCCEVTSGADLPTLEKALGGESLRPARHGRIDTGDVFFLPGMLDMSAVETLADWGGIALSAC